MVKAVAFDLDHTLYDRNATWDALMPVIRRVYASYIPGRVTGERLCSAFKLADYNATYKETSWKGMYLELLAAGVISEKMEYAFFRDFVYEYFPPAIVPYKDTYSVLTWCRAQGLRPSVITNGHPELQAKKIAAMDLLSYVDECIVCNLDTGVGCKPEPDAFLELADRLSLKPSEMLYVGDNPRNDIMGAKHAGMRTAWLNVMDNWLDGYERADYEISSLSELFDVVNQLSDIDNS